jgi:hypothetical protein
VEKEECRPVLEEDQYPTEFLEAERHIVVLHDRDSAEGPKSLTMRHGEPRSSPISL